jgi:hypothetical protein
MANTGAQLDKLSLENCIITKAQKKEVKRQHKRRKRREAKNIDFPSPQYNKYDGWVA